MAQRHPVVARIRYPFGTVRHVISKWLLSAIPVRWRSECIHRCRPWDLSTPATRDRNATVLAMVGEVLPLAAACVFEVGCSRGVFTEELAAKCRQVSTIDISETACANARERLESANNVSVRVADIEHDAIEGEYDVVFAMDVLYFFRGRTRLHRVLDRLSTLTRPGGLLVITDCRMSEAYRNAWFQRWWPYFGDAYIDLAGSRDDLEVVARRAHLTADPDYPEHVIGILRRLPPRS